MRYSKVFCSIFAACILGTCAWTSSAAEATNSLAEDAVAQTVPPLESLLDAIVSDILTNDTAKTIVDSYGTPGEKEVVLVNTTASIPWPQSYAPTNIAGWHCIPDKDYKRPTRSQLMKVNRKLGIRLDRLHINLPVPDSLLRNPDGGPIEVTVSNCGGFKNGDTMGGAFYEYSAKVQDGKWIIKFGGSFGV